MIEGKSFSRKTGDCLFTSRILFCFLQNISFIFNLPVTILIVIYGIVLFSFHRKKIFTLWLYLVKKNLKYPGNNVKFIDFEKALYDSRSLQFHNKIIWLHSRYFLCASFLCALAPLSGLLLDTHCVRYPHAITFSNFVWNFCTPKTLTLHSV